jgi:hypothetical protein
MKSPWKFLARLASLGQAPAGQERAFEINPAEPIKPSPSTKPEVPATPPLESSDAVPNEIEFNRLEEKRDADVGGLDLSEKTVPIPLGHEIAEVSFRSQHASATRLLPAKQRKKGKPRPINVVGLIASENASLDARLPPSTENDEIAILDEEIKQLRRQLTEKLLLQNAQLKKMLKRFDPL